MVTDSELKLDFLFTELNAYGYELKSLMVKTIEEKSIIDKDKLRGSIGFKVIREGNGAKIQFNFPDYGRLVEINYNKRKGSRSKEIYGKTDINELISGKRSKKKSRGKDSKWYNITVYGTLYDLIGRVMYGFTDEVKESLIKQFHSK